jgi:hypothetical protein
MSVAAPRKPSFLTSFTDWRPKCVSLQKIGRPCGKMYCQGERSLRSTSPWPTSLSFDANASNPSSDAFIPVLDQCPEPDLDRMSYALSPRRRRSRACVGKRAGQRQRRLIASVPRKGGDCAHAATVSIRSHRLPSRMAWPHRPDIPNNPLYMHSGLCLCFTIPSALRRLLCFHGSRPSFASSPLLLALRHAELKEVSGCAGRTRKGSE